MEKCFKKENLTIDDEKLEKYLEQQKYFPFQLLDWEKFCFALHNCVFREDGQLRWSILVIYVGRGAGKNGYLSFEDFCLLTKIHGIKEYNIDIFAMSEEQAETTFKDIYNILEENKKELSRYFYWNKEVIRNKATNSELKFRTSGIKTKDGGRPGKVDFDEYHAYENMKLVNVAVTGLGKKAFPRRTIITTDGDVRDGPLDKLLERGRKVLNGEQEDNGTLFFFCALESDEEIEDKKAWEKANPSLPFFPVLLAQIEQEFIDYLEDPISNNAFATKRMNRPQGDKEKEVTEWENIVAANQEMPDLTGRHCVAGIDFAKLTDFAAAGLLFIVDGKHYWITHTWVCKDSADLKRIKPPLKEWEKKGDLTFVDDVEIDPSIPVNWIREKRKKYKILGVGIDDFRYGFLKKQLMLIGFEPIRRTDQEKKTRNIIKLIRPSDEMLVSPTISSLFKKQLIAWGNNPLMNWYTHNVAVKVDKKGNETYEKIEPKSRKTDGFKAFAAAECMVEPCRLEKYSKKTKRVRTKVATY